MKRINSLQVTVTALCVAINIVGAFLGVALKLPIYLDHIGSVLASALIGPFWGASAACLSGIFSGFTSDPYAFYFILGGVITALLAGVLFRGTWLRGAKTPVGVLFMTVPGTIVSACTAAFVFDGVTSAGSSILVQIMDRMGLNLVVSAFLVQFFTEYADRLILVIVAGAVMSQIGETLKARLRQAD